MSWHNAKLWIWIVTLRWFRLIKKFRDVFDLHLIWFTITLFLSLLNWFGLSLCLFVSARCFSARCIIVGFITAPSSSCWPSQTWFNFEQDRHKRTNLFVSSLGYCQLKDSFKYIYKSFHSNILRSLIWGTVPTGKSEKFLWMENCLFWNSCPSWKVFVTAPRILKIQSQNSWLLQILISTINIWFGLLAYCFQQGSLEIPTRPFQHYKGAEYHTNSIVIGKSCWRQCNQESGCMNSR